MKNKERKKIREYIFSVIAPGTPLREAINRIQEANLGALIVLGNLETLKDVKAGGFELNAEYTPQGVYELAKMDGGIIVSKDIKTIYGANVQIQPDYKIKTDESGTRHQAAHRLAQQKGCLVVTVSERRNKITAYIGKERYPLHDISDLLVKSSQAITALEKYSLAIENSLVTLSILEFDNMVTLYDVIEIVRTYGLLFEMSEELMGYMTELGTEGRLIRIQYQEIMLNKEEKFISLIKDYKIHNKRAEKIIEEIKTLNKEELLINENIVNILGYEQKKLGLDDIMESRGYNLLSNVNKITKKDTELLVKEFSGVQSILLANVEDFAQIKGISKQKSNHIVKSLRRLKNRSVFERD